MYLDFRYFPFPAWRNFFWMLQQGCSCKEKFFGTTQTDFSHHRKENYPLYFTDQTDRLGLWHLTFMLRPEIFEPALKFNKYSMHRLLLALFNITKLSLSLWFNDMKIVTNARLCYLFLNSYMVISEVPCPLFSTRSIRSSEKILLAVLWSRLGGKGNHSESNVPLSEDIFKAKLKP